MYQKNKYKAKKIEIDGFTFDSKKEANRWLYLKRIEQAGFIKDLKRQVPFVLAKVIDGTDYIVRTPTGRSMCYFADFSYYDKEKKRIVYEDVKGFDTPVSEIKRAIVDMFYGVKVNII